jgi:alpha-methylacyl-CoA racemase
VGPLVGVKVVEFAGMGPGPMASMLLSDLGANIIRIERHDVAEAFSAGYSDPVMRGRDAIFLNLKEQDEVRQALRLIERADVLIEGFRPGVMEALGLGPAVCLARNPALVYARMTGWGQTGRLAKRAGHDINYIALSGALHRIGRAGQPPTVPLNLIGDYGGGALYLALGVVCGVLHSCASGKGQVIDVAMIDGTASLMAKQYGLFAAGLVRSGRERNLLDGGAPFYNVYACSDGHFVAVGAIEAKFFAELLRGLEIEPSSIPSQHDRERWPEMRQAFTDRFASRSRDAWSDIFAQTDACVTPVLSMDEAPLHPHIRERDTFLSLGGVVQPAPAPRFVGTPPEVPSPSGRKTVEAAIRAWETAGPGTSAQANGRSCGHGPMKAAGIRDSSLPRDEMVPPPGEHAPTPTPTSEKAA